MKSLRPCYLLVSHIEEPVGIWPSHDWQGGELGNHEGREGNLKDTIHWTMVSRCSTVRHSCQAWVVKYAVK